MRKRSPLKPGELNLIRFMPFYLDSRHESAGKSQRKAEAFERVCKEIQEAVWTDGPWETAKRLRKSFNWRSE